MVYNKTLDVKDYENLRSEEAHINYMKYIFSNIQYSFEHKHRMWEYGIVLKALKENQTKTLLDVGGGASIFAPACAFTGMDVTQVDLEDRKDWVAKQNEILPEKRRVEYIREDFFNFSYPQEFDAVTVVKEHLRTYREADLVPFFTSDGDFTIFREDIDYTWRGPDVNSYTFASIILRRDYE
jgi:2-polyprenyl-3-methyl-5-hydroxy-6-metoxy-1,4-benzoquinol methylase